MNNGISEGNEKGKAHKSFTLLGADKKSYISKVPGTYGGHRKSKIYGRMDCTAANRAISKGGYVKERIFFADEQTAIAAGFRPCGVCLPEKYAIWKNERK